MRATNSEDDWKKRCIDLEQQHEQVLGESELLAKVLLRVSAVAEGVDQELDQQLPALQETIRSYPPGAEFQALAQTLDGGILRVMQRRDDNISLSLESFSQILKSLEALDNAPHVVKRIDTLREGLDVAVEQYYQYPRLLNDLADIQRLILDDQEQQREQLATDELPPVGETVSEKGAESPLAAVESPPGDYQFACSQVGSLLLKVLEQLVIPNDMLPKAHSLRVRIEQGVQWGDLEALFHDAVELAIKSALSDQQDFENYLRGLNGQLEDIQSFLGDTEIDSTAARESIVLLDQSLRDDVARVESSLSLDNIDLLKHSVRAQLDGILQAVDRYKDEQSEREKRAEQRLEHLQATITEMEKQSADVQKHLEEQRLRAVSDPLTGLPNRAAYDECIHARMEDLVNQEQLLTLVVCDLDHFKEVNDNYGHLAGDKVLRLVAKILRGALRPNDFIGRYGGEEFVIVLADTAAPPALELMDKLRRVMAQSPFNFKGQPVRVTMSFGIAQGRADETAEELFSRADRALYQAKESGRNRCVVAD